MSPNILSPFCFALRDCETEFPNQSLSTDSVARHNVELTETFIKPPDAVLLQSRKKSANHYEGQTLMSS